MSAFNNTQPLTVEVLEEQSLTVSQFAKACNVSETWLVQRVRSGVIYLNHDARDAEPAPDVHKWRFTGQSLLRTRRIADLERIFDADPQLAAMTADLIDEVRALRKILNRGD
ncbi:MAG: MerR family transcriptional regulator [Lautropia sp.]|nr:MerR family transcriptional regulator [Lautropia sp.]